MNMTMTLLLSFFAPYCIRNHHAAFKTDRTIQTLFYNQMLSLIEREGAANLPWTSDTFF